MWVLFPKLWFLFPGFSCFPIQICERHSGRRHHKLWALFPSRSTMFLPCFLAIGNSKCLRDYAQPSIISSTMKALTLSQTLNPRLDLLPAPQQRIWGDLRDVPSGFVLWGGTALALHLGHRQSVDFDFFSDTNVDFDNMLRGVPLLQGCQVTGRSAGSMNCIVDRDGPVKLSFFAVPGVLSPTEPAHIVSENGLHVASVRDLSAMKVKVVQDRAEAKDYIDVDAILRLSDISLREALATAKHVYGTSFNPAISLKALAFFGDGSLQLLPEDVKQRLRKAVRDVDPSRLPSLTRTAVTKKNKDRER